MNNDASIHREPSKRELDDVAAKRELELREQDAEKAGEQKGKEAVVKKLLNMGMDIETAVEGTGIDIEKVIEIQEELNSK